MICFILVLYIKMLQYMNDALKPLSELDTQIHDTLKKTVDELDKRLKQANVTEEYYLVEFYQWDDGSERSHELYRDRKDAEKRFFEIMKYRFEDDIKQAWFRDDIEWEKMYNVDTGNFKFTKDCYESYYDRRAAQWKYWEDPMYPRWVWKAYNPDYYNEVTLKKMIVNKVWIKSEDEKKETN